MLAEHFENLQIITSKGPYRAKACPSKYHSSATFWYIITTNMPSNHSNTAHLGPKTGKYAPK